MANEITVYSGMQLINGQLEAPSTQKNRQYDQATGRIYDVVHDIGTSEETISFVDCDPGYIELLNIDATNFATFGFVTANLDGKLRANGGYACLELVSGGGSSLIIKADTAAVKIRIRAFNV